VELAVDDIMRRHYNISGRPIDDPVTLAETRYLITSALGDLTKYEDRYSAVEAWDYNNRQAKLIVNSVRVYEFWGYQWWLPLEDRELMDLWCSLPLELRREKKLMKLSVEALSKELLKGAEVSIYKKATSPVKPTGVVSSILKNKAIAKVVSIPYYRRRKKTQYHEHPQAVFGAIPWKRYQKEFTGRESINYFHAMCFLERLTRRCGRTKAREEPTSQ
jgi:hypothetical protein